MNIFPRPSTPKGRSQPPPRPTEATPAETEIVIPQAEPSGTYTAVFGIIVTGMMMQGDQPSHLARFAAIGVGLSLCFSLAADFRRGLKNLIRADVMAILAFYFLTFFEFLFPQPDFDTMIIVSSTRTAIVAVLTGFVGLLVGRHLLRPKQQPFGAALTTEVPARWLVIIFWIATLVGYLHMFIAVDFSIVQVVHYMMEARFSQPWARGRLGDWKALLVELGMLINLLPPLAGIIFARRQRYPKVQVVLIILVFFFTLFYGFSSGTRNVFASFLVTFLIGYTFAVPPGRNKELITLSLTCAVAMFVATTAMLRFRDVGLNRYLAGATRGMQVAQSSLFVDYNLFAIGKLTEVFPNRWAYLGWEIPLQAVIRPIPRALWKGKPEGLSASIEDALGVEGLTIAASFAGEAYMSGGDFAVLLAGLFFGAATGWWSHLCSPRNSELGILIYASGFFAAVISMRSLLVFTTALLPTAAAIVLCVYVARALAKQARKLLTRAFTPRRPPPRPRPPAPERRQA